VRGHNCNGTYYPDIGGQYQPDYKGRLVTLSALGVDLIYLALLALADILKLAAAGLLVMAAFESIAYAVQTLRR